MGPPTAIPPSRDMSTTLQYTGARSTRLAQTRPDALFDRAKAFVTSVREPPTAVDSVYGDDAKEEQARSNVIISNIFAEVLWRRGRK